MTAVPWDLVEREFAALGVAMETLPSRNHRAVGMMFMPCEEKDAAVCRETVEATMRQSGLAFHGWRKVPIDPSYLGPLSRENQPTIEQVCCAHVTIGLTTYPVLWYAVISPAFDIIGGGIARFPPSRPEITILGASHRAFERGKPPWKPVVMFARVRMRG